MNRSASPSITASTKSVTTMPFITSGEYTGTR